MLGHQAAGSIRVLLSDRLHYRVVLKIQLTHRGRRQQVMSEDAFHGHNEPLDELGQQLVVRRLPMAAWNRRFRARYSAAIASWRRASMCSGCSGTSRAARLAR